MNRIVNASPTNPSATSLSGFTPSSWGCRNPRLYSCVAIVDVLTCRNFSNVPSGSGSSSVIVSSPGRQAMGVVRGRSGSPAARYRAGRAGREPQLGLQPLVDAGCTGPFLCAGLDQFRLATGPPAQRALGVQPVAAEVHQGSAGEVERPAWVAVVRLGHRDEGV